MKRKIMLFVVGFMLGLSLLIGISYLHYKINVNKNNDRMTNAKANKLIYTGDNEISIFGTKDSFVKTFTVENNSSLSSKYNIYMENITNGFDDNLTYKITDDEGNIIIPQTTLPKTNSDKIYFKKNIIIGPFPTVQNYILTIECVDKSVDQDANFNATLGIDSELFN